MNNQTRMNTRTLACLTAGIFAAFFSGCANYTPKVGVLLADDYNTPDGMILAPDGNIYLDCPNYNQPEYPGKLLRITQDNNIQEVFTYPAHPKTGKSAPLGIDAGPDGNFYVTDNQSFYDKNNQSRLLRLVMKNGKVARCEVLVTGFVESNAVSARPDGVYVTETQMDPAAWPLPSGVYRFRYDEFAGEPIELKPLGKDPHLIVRLATGNPDWRVGANGMGFDSKGNMYVCNFGEATIMRYTFDASGAIASSEIFASGQGMESCDGIKFDPRNDDMYVADFAGNAVHRIDKNGKVTTIWKNANDSDGIGGLLDRPSEVCLRGNKLYISNIDLPVKGNRYDQLHTISVIDVGR
jgi:sugar lactone lactonase YvrE